MSQHSVSSAEIHAPLSASVGDAKRPSPAPSGQTLIPDPRRKGPLQLGLLSFCMLVLALVPSNSGRAAAPLGVGGREDHLLLRTEAACVEVNLAAYRLRIVGPTGEPLFTREEAASGVFYERSGSVHHLTRVLRIEKAAQVAALTVDTDEGSPATVTLHWLTPRTLEVTVQPANPTTLTAFGDRFSSPKDEVIYGLTERLRDSPPIFEGFIDVPIEEIKPREVGSLNRRGEKIAMYVRPTFSLYAPFFQSSRGYGLAIAGTTVGSFDVAKTDPEIVSFRFEAGSRAENQRLQFYIFIGPDHGGILDEYTKLVGRPFVPPNWAFLHWRWRDELHDGPSATLDGIPMNAEFVDDVSMYDKLGIPPGVYHFDRPVLVGEYGFARFVWDEMRLPHPTAMLEALDLRGYHKQLFSAMWACGSHPGDHGAEAKQLGFLAPGPRGPPHCADLSGISFIIDVTNPKAQAWWREKLAAFVRTSGIRGIKLDRGEEHIPSKATDLWADGRTGREVHNDYPTLQAKIHYDALKSVYPEGDFLVVARAGYTGTPRYAIFWGGDIAGSESFGMGPGTDLGLRSAIVSQERAAFLGAPIWGSDTGGYYEFKNREVFARWLEFSAFSGIMEIGGQGLHAPWKMPTTPHYDEEMIDIYRRYTQLRVTLLPYIVSAAAQAGATGMPIVRPMPFFDREDPRLTDRWDQYMFGPDLMVAPIWHVGQRSREVYFPRGGWRSYWDPRQTYKGPGTITLPVPLDVILVFVREGASVPAPGVEGPRRAQSAQ